MADTIAEALTQITNAEKIGRGECILKKSSRLLKEVLAIMNKEGYIGEFETINDGKSGIIKIQLLGKINKAGAIRPRFSVHTDGFEKFEKRYLPAKNFGLLIISTTKGTMTHENGKKLGIGGQLLAYVW